MATFNPKGFSWVRSLGGGKKRKKKSAAKTSNTGGAAGKGNNSWRAYVSGGKKR
jgi:hypothetical protein